MTQAPLTLNSLPTDLSLKDVLDLWRKQILLDFNCHHIGTIQSFNSVNQTVTVTINYTKTRFEQDPTTGLYNPVQENYPILTECPLVILGGGNANLTFPISPGDECLLLFNDRNIDTWFQTGLTAPVATFRLHSISDAVALVGLRSFSNFLDNYDTTRAVLSNGTTMVGVSQSKVKIANDSTTLNTLLQNILTQLENLAQGVASLTVTCAAPGNPSSVPINAAVFTMINTQLTTLATELGGLLE